MFIIPVVAILPLLKENVINRFFFLCYGGSVNCFSKIHIFSSLFLSHVRL